MLLLLSTVALDLLRLWQGIPGIERTEKGRVYVSWYSGGPKEPSIENTVYLAYSDDDGKTFLKAAALAGPREGSRAFDPTLWIDPQKRLWYIFNRGNRETARHDVYARICERPDARTPAWSEEFRLGFDDAPFAFRMNKPVALSTGEWLLPVTHAATPSHEWFARPNHLHGVAISTDRGKTWKMHGAVKAPDFALENMVVELRDRRLWMLIRTGGGVLWESFSNDRGRTWSEGKASTIANPGSRFFIRRLASGKLLLVNHYKFKGRNNLTAQFSSDEGKTWSEGVLLDERGGVSYPDAVQAKDGTIWIVYDRDRAGAGEILLARIREDGPVQLRQVIQNIDRAAPGKLLPPDWDAKAAGDRVMKGMIKTTAPEVKGAHDADMVLVGDRAFIVTMANDVKPGENAEWPYIYVAMAVVDLTTMKVEKIFPVVRGGQKFANDTLPEGACFVPRIVAKDARTLRVFFASEAPRQREAQTYYRDFDLTAGAFSDRIEKAKIKTAAGTFDMQPRPFYDDAAKHGFTREPKDFGLYMIDSFKVFDGKMYSVLNNYPAGQNALSVLNRELDTFEVLGHFNHPNEWKLSESSVNRMPDGTWLAICRQDAGNRNYTFATSKDGRTWTANEHRAFVPDGANSKPLFERFFGVYYLGWQEATRVNGVSRSVFNIDVSVDGVNWERKYRFATSESFQYPGLRLHRGTIYIYATQGAKARIMFGRLE